MTGEEYRTALEMLGLTVESAAKFLRMDPRISHRIFAGDDSLHWARAALLRVMVTHDISVHEVNALMTDFNETEME